MCGASNHTFFVSSHKFLRFSFANTSYIYAITAMALATYLRFDFNLILSISQCHFIVAQKYFAKRKATENQTANNDQEIL
jgi:hypothetical protein